MLVSSLQPVCVPCGLFEKQRHGRQWSLVRALRLASAASGDVSVAALDGFPRATKVGMRPSVGLIEERLVKGKGSTGTAAPTNSRTAGWRVAGKQATEHNHNNMHRMPSSQDVVVTWSLAPVGDSKHVTMFSGAEASGHFAQSLYTELTEYSGDGVAVATTSPVRARHHPWLPLRPVLEPINKVRAYRLGKLSRAHDQTKTSAQLDGWVRRGARRFANLVNKDKQRSGRRQCLHSRLLPATLDCVTCLPAPLRARPAAGPCWPGPALQTVPCFKVCLWERGLYDVLETEVVQKRRRGTAGICMYGACCMCRIVGGSWPATPFNCGFLMEYRVGSMHT
ncbi:uncharacterized protein MAM_03087 [Metarhizium album ARSEF 1941]|uniref:Uncharacterized protein n=1 Tax=Metarhizium album (strain ARSEF 1941) TaxID=1081103 RepID=A0A0B2X0L5_METAS|nr:uncharacterized protein MAM_03087 [Metarhizium album ARSEF 1941]KHN99389.1 hypothetical protein MAM_03087 [Metarhizium album ARSEF 1941]